MFVFVADALILAKNSCLNSEQTAFSAFAPVYGALSSFGCCLVRVPPSPCSAALDSPLLASDCDSLMQVRCERRPGCYEIIARQSHDAKQVHFACGTCKSLSHCRLLRLQLSGRFSCDFLPSRSGHSRIKTLRVVCPSISIAVKSSAWSCSRPWLASLTSSQISRSALGVIAPLCCGRSPHFSCQCWPLALTKAVLSLLRLAVPLTAVKSQDALRCGCTHCQRSEVIFRFGFSSVPVSFLPSVFAFLSPAVLVCFLPSVFVFFLLLVAG